MQKLSDVRFPAEADIPSLKELWHISFGDDYEYIDDFFQKAFHYQNALCIDDGNRVVSALYLLDCSINKGNVTYKAYYVYAVATLPEYRGQGLMGRLLAGADDVARSRDASYLFLVPAEASLYDAYGRHGYEKGFYRQEVLVEKSCDSVDCTATAMDYDAYLQCNKRFAEDGTVSYGVGGFHVFVAPCGEDYGYVYVENAGYCVYGSVDSCVTVYELVGDEDVLLNKLFEVCGACAVRLRSSGLQGGSPCGMYKAFGGSPKIDNAFIGAYGG